jgi:RNA polymerase sigma factor (sigma-70 family)
VGIQRAEEAIQFIQAMQAGDEDAFTKLMPILTPIVERAVRHFTYGSARYRDDFLQEAWIGVYRAAKTYDAAHYPVLVASYFTNAITNQLVRIDRQHTNPVAIPRPLARFMHDIAKGHIDWSQSNDEIRRSYPNVKLADIDHLRAGGTYTATCINNFTEVCDLQSGDMGFDEWATTQVDIEQLLNEIRMQIGPEHYRVFELRFLQDLSRPAVAKMMRLSVMHLYRLEHQLLATRLLLHYPSQDEGKRETLRSLLARTLAPVS